MKVLVHIVSIAVLLAAIFASFILRIQNIDMSEWRFGITYWYLGVLILLSVVTAGLTSGSEYDGNR